MQRRRISIASVVSGGDVTQQWTDSSGSVRSTSSASPVWMRQLMALAFPARFPPSRRDSAHSGKVLNWGSVWVYYVGPFGWPHVAKTIFGSQVGPKKAEV